MQILWQKLNDNFEFCNSKCENYYEKMMDKDSHVKIKHFTLGIILGFLGYVLWHYF